MAKRKRRSGAARPRSAPKKRRPRAPAKRRSRYTQVALCALLLAAVGSIVTYLWVDRRVTARLVERRFDEIPAIYSDVMRVSAELPLGAAALKNELLARGYTETAAEPREPGEFNAAGGSIRGITREFRLPSGRMWKQAQFRFPFSAAEREDAAFFYLEPRVIAALGSGDQRANRFKPLAQIPQHVRQAVIATEDERFYDHHGLDLIGIARAIFTNIRAMRLVQGGSTLTQQLAKNVLFSPSRTLTRKVLEAFAAIAIERRLPKDRILELYLNEVYLGQEGSLAIHGVAAAAQSFFGKPLDEISVPEAALLAGIIRAPSSYAPRRHLARAIERRNTVLLKMAELKFISSAEAERGMKTKPAIIKESPFERKAPFFVEALRTELGRVIDTEGASLNGMRVYTGLEPALQECAEEAVRDGMRRLESRAPALAKRSKKLEVGFVAIEPQSGLVRAWVGGRDYRGNQFDHVSQGQRQIGSTIKPFVYLTALDGSLNHYKVARATSILSDEPVRIDAKGAPAWEPENFDKRFRGDVTLRYALENSLNLPSVYLIQRVGPDAVAETVRRFRVADQVPPVHALALGALDTSLLRLTSAFGALANGGAYVAPRLFTAVVDSSNDTVATGAFEEHRAAAEESVYVLTDILRGVIDRGTAASARTLGFRGAAAGKTGTSDEARDAWFVGFTPNLVAGVWVGFDDNKKIGLSGGAAAVPIWTKFMQCAAPYHEELNFIRPPGVAAVSIDRVSGRTATAGCPRENVVSEVFVRGTEPTVPCPLHRGGDYGDDGQPRRRGFWEGLFG